MQAANDLAFEDIESGEPRRCAMSFVVVGHCAGAALLHRQAGLHAVERLDLCLFVDREDDGTGGRIDIKPHHIAQLVDELRVVGEFELLNPVWLQTVRVPDALNGTRANADGLRHHRGTVGRLDGRIGAGERDHTLGYIRPERWNTRGSCFIAQEAVVTSLHEAFLPAPYAGLRLPSPPHDLMGVDAVRAQQNNLGMPDLFTQGIAIPSKRCQTAAVTGLESDGNSGSHAANSHATSSAGNPSSDSNARFDPLGAGRHQMSECNTIVENIGRLWTMSAAIRGEEKGGVVRFTRRLRFLFKALSAYRSVKQILDAPRQSPLGKLMQCRPQTIGAVIWPYQCAGWDVHTRLARIRDHYSVIEKIGGTIDFPVDGQISLLDLSDICEGFHVVVDQPEWFIREGQLAINLFLGDVRMYILAFSLFHQGSVIAAFVGAIQGRDIEEALEKYRGLTKASHGMRPRDFLIEVFRMFCAELGVSKIFAVSEEFRHHRDPYFGPVISTKEFSTNYNEVWIERGGVRVDPMFYQLSVTDPERVLAAIPAKKRGMYRRRFEMLRRIKEQMHDRCGSLELTESSR